MKLLIITEGYYPYVGGLEKIVTEIAQGLNQKCDYEVTVLTSIREKMEPFQKEVKGVNIYYAPLSVAHGKIEFIKELLCARKIMKELLKNHFDFVSIQYLGYFATLFYSIKTNVPYTISIHGNDVTKDQGILGKFIQKKIVSHSKAVISNSHYLANLLEIKLSVCIKNKIYVIWNGIQLEKYKASKKLADEKVIVSVGRFEYKKGFDILIKAFAEVLKRVPDAKLIIAGNGDEKSKCMTLTEQLGISKKVIFLGQVPNDNIDKVFSKGRVFVCPSRNEPFGIVVLEAMAMGIPVITTDCGGVREIVGNNKYGYIVPAENKDAIAEKIIDLLENQDKCNDLRNKGFKRVQDFTIENVVARYDAVIKMCL